MISENLKKTFLSFLKMVSDNRIISIESMILEYPEIWSSFKYAQRIGDKIIFNECNTMVTIKVKSLYPIHTGELVDISHKFRSTFKPQLHDCGIKIECDIVPDYFV